MAIFDAKNSAHRRLFRNMLTITNLGNQQTVDTMTGLLDYIDELERDNLSLRNRLIDKDVGEAMGIN
jgi:hypothetical protein